MTTGTTRRTQRWAIAALVTATTLLAAACVMPPPPAAGVDPDLAPQAGDAAYTEPGPYPVGVTTLALADREVEVWYPADAAGIGTTPRDEYFIRDFVPPAFDALIPASVNPPYVTNAHRGVPAASDGPFPLAIFSHGAASFRLQSSELTTHLASWGFVVISPDYFERGLTSVLGAPPATPRADTVVADEAIELARSASAEPASLLSGVVAPGDVYPFGHSAGGGTSLRLLSRPDVRAIVPMASGILGLSILNGSAPPLPADKSVFWMGGQNDGIANIDNVRTGYTYTAGQKKILELAKTGHNNAFTDICEIGEGGVAELAIATGLPIPPSLLNLGNDGCPAPPFRESAQVWPEVKHFLTAEFRYRAGLDVEPVGLGTQVTASFDDVARYEHAP